MRQIEINMVVGDILLGFYENGRPVEIGESSWFMCPHCGFERLRYKAPRRPLRTGKLPDGRRAVPLKHAFYQYCGLKCQLLVDIAPIANADALVMLVEEHPELCAVS